jgi:serine-type D-Ala-D-Ala carboxypeptidase (penicillin-binding protein 5/6)
VTAQARPRHLVALVAAAALWGAGGAAGTARAASPPPHIQAAAAILVQPQTGEVVYARQPDRERLIASTTKMMTALVTIEHLPLGRVLRAAPYHPAPAESIVGLIPGERMTVRDLLRALLLPSANDAAVTLADGVAGSTTAFVRMMNARARSLGLRHTHYANPIGLDAPGNYSTARDLVRLAAQLLRQPFLAETVNRPAATLRTGAHPRTIVNRNGLVRTVPWVDGVKTGHTNAAGDLLVAAASRDGVRMLSAVLGEPSESARDADSLALLRYGLARYRRLLPVRRGQVLAHVALAYRPGQAVDLAASRTVGKVVRRTRRATVRVTGVPTQINGPLARGAREGTAVVRVAGRVVARVPLLTTRAVTEASLSQRASHFVSRPLTIALAAVLAACSLQLALMRRQAVRRRRRRRQRETTEVA